MNAMTAFNVSYLVLFVFVPLNVICFGEDVIRQKYAYETYGSGDAWTAFCLLFSYILFSLGYSWKSPKKRGISSGHGAFSLRDSTRVAKSIFFIGIFLTAVYVIQIGGISKVITEATAVRFGEVRLEGKYVFYRYFSQFSADAFVLFFAIVSGKRVRKIGIRAREKVFLFFALVFFVYYALSTAGRRPFIYPILLCFLVYWSMGAKTNKAAIVALALIFIIAGLGTILGPIILSGHASTVFDMFDINQADWKVLLTLTYDNTLQGLGDSYIHFVAMQKASLWQFGFLRDIVNLPQDFLPSRLLGFQRNWELYRQINDFFGEQLPEASDGGPLGGGEPLGLHGYLLVNFGYLGMFVLFFVLGLFYKWVHIRLKPDDCKDAVGWLIYWWVVIGFFVYFRDGFLIYVIKDQLTWWLIAALLLYYRANRQAALARMGAKPSLTSYHT
ncbi:MAG TPA: hypothetical protein VEI52_17305 [Terriglobales bacterium]|nr:hypothetical protein [Terriglobales bacterium]